MRVRMMIVIALMSLAGKLPAAELERPAPTPDSLQAEVDYLRSIMPGQAFAMTQIAYNFSNLWFAAQAGNWPLANFYLGETRVRLRWAMRIQPVRRISSGPIEIAPIAEALEANQIMAVGHAIEARDKAGFVAAYTNLMHGCQGCHEASEKPYLKLQIPTAPAEPMIDFAP
ncbi:MAG: hypothetical protein H6978_08825 [Gammaproteobacteria bacterium]|nr:hypothetical protein [Gammaproteobacteria bacterium]